VTPLDIFSDLGDLALRFDGTTPQQIAEKIRWLIETKEGKSVLNDRREAVAQHNQVASAAVQSRLIDRAIGLGRIASRTGTIDSSKWTMIGATSGPIRFPTQFAATSGMVMHGPYVTLQRGIYHFRLIGNSEGVHGKSLGFVKVTAKAGSEELGTFDIVRRPGRQLASCVFSVVHAELGAIEFVVYLNGSAAVEVDKFVLDRLSHQSF
jgi:hypothetical protein